MGEVKKSNVYCMEFSKPISIDDNMLKFWYRVQHPSVKCDTFSWITELYISKKILNDKKIFNNYKTCHI